MAEEQGIEQRSARVAEALQIGSVGERASLESRMRIFEREIALEREQAADAARKTAAESDHLSKRVRELDQALTAESGKAEAAAVELAAVQQRNQELERIIAVEREVARAQADQAAAQAGEFAIRLASAEQLGADNAIWAQRAAQLEQSFQVEREQTGSRIASLIEQIEAITADALMSRQRAEMLADELSLERAQWSARVEAAVAEAGGLANRVSAAEVAAEIAAQRIARLEDELLAANADNEALEQALATERERFAVRVREAKAETDRANLEAEQARKDVAERAQAELDRVRVAQAQQHEITALVGQLNSVQNEIEAERERSKSLAETAAGEIGRLTEELSMLRVVLDEQQTESDRALRELQDEAARRVEEINRIQRESHVAQEQFAAREQTFKAELKDVKARLRSVELILADERARASYSSRAAFTDLSAMRESLGQALQTVQRLQDEATGREEHLRGTNERMNALLNSRMWKLTAPLRALKDGASKLK